MDNYGTAVLRYDSEVSEAINALKALNLPLHSTRVKNWDVFRAISFVNRHCERNAYILDVGCWNCPILAMAKVLGFRNLYGCDLVKAGLGVRFVNAIRRCSGFASSRLSKQDLHSTSYASEYFDVVTSISVIEHAVRLPDYFQEMARLLKPGGYLLTSFDYWEVPLPELAAEPVMTRWGPMRVFSSDDVSKMLDVASEAGFKSLHPFESGCVERVTQWHGVRFTFAYLVLQRNPI